MRTDDQGQYADLVYVLDALTDEDSERPHAYADRLVLGLLTRLGAQEVAMAYKRARDRCGFWYS